MEAEKRAYPRYSPEGIRAGITVEKLGLDQIPMTGEIIDISSTGIKTKRNSPYNRKSTPQNQNRIRVSENRHPGKNCAIKSFLDSCQ